MCKKTPICLQTEDFLQPPSQAWLSLNANLVIHFTSSSTIRGGRKENWKKNGTKKFAGQKLRLFDTRVVVCFDLSCQSGSVVLTWQRFLNSVCLPIVVCSTRIHFTADKGKKDDWQQTYKWKGLAMEQFLT